MAAALVTGATSGVDRSGEMAQQAVGRWSEVFSGRYGAYTLVLNLGTGLFAINQFVVATLMPTIVADLGGVGYYAWAFSLFAVGSIVGAASAGPLREAFGAKRAYLGAGLVLGAGLAGAALATDMPTLVAWRLVQGIGGGAVASVELQRRVARLPRRSRRQGVAELDDVGRIRVARRVGA